MEQDSDFEPTSCSDDSIGSSDKIKLITSRVSVLYDASSLFECALAATLQCEKSTAAIPGHADYSIVINELLGHRIRDQDSCQDAQQSTIPHAIVILGNNWPIEFYEEVMKVEAIKNILLVVLCDTVKPSSYPNVINVTPPLFAKIAPCKGEISAFVIFSHLLRGEFSHHFQDGLEDARYFRLALRSSVRATLEAWTFVNSIVTDWHRVMEPDSLVQYGRFLANVGPSIARKRIAAHSVMISLASGAPDFKEYQIRVIECPDFDEVVRNVALQTNPIVITYELSADTTQCHLVCDIRAVQVNEQPKELASEASSSEAPDSKEKASEASTSEASNPEASASEASSSEASNPEASNPEAPASVKIDAPPPSAREILSLFTPMAEVGPETNKVTCSTNDFFALVRKSILLPSDKLGSADKILIAEGEKVLKEMNPYIGAGKAQ